MRRGRTPQPVNKDELNNMTALKTIDTDFAAAMMTRGARLVDWQKSQDGRKLYWHLAEINPNWMTDYRDGKDGVMKFMSCRKMLVNVAKTEIQQERRQPMAALT